MACNLKSNSYDKLIYSLPIYCEKNYKSAQRKKSANIKFCNEVKNKSVETHEVQGLITNANRYDI